MEESQNLCRTSPWRSRAPLFNEQIATGDMLLEMRYCEISKEMSSWYFGLTVLCQFEGRVPEFVTQSLPSTAVDWTVYTLCTLNTVSNPNGQFLGRLEYSWVLTPIQEYSIRKGRGCVTANCRQGYCVIRIGRDRRGGDPRTIPPLRSQP